MKPESQGPPGYEASEVIDASIVIVSFNTRELLRECLHSVLEQGASVKLEILVVDNCSSDGSAEMVEAEFPSVRLFRAAVNLGFGAANNMAMEHATGRYIVLLNSDAFFQPGALAHAIRHMDETPSCGLGGGLQVGRDGSWQPSARAFHSVLGDLIVATGLAWHFRKSRIFGNFDRTWADPNEPAEVDWVPGSFCIVRPSALAKVGLFDPKFFLYYEEVDLCRRLKAAGYSIWYWPDILIVHLGGESSKGIETVAFSPHSAQVASWRIRSAFLYYRKHHGAQAYLAKLSEATMCRLTILRNRFSKVPWRRERLKHYLALLPLIEQAWEDTRGGRYSPPRPW